MERSRRDRPKAATFVACAPPWVWTKSALKLISGAVLYWVWYGIVCSTQKNAKYFSQDYSRQNVADLSVERSRRDLPKATSFVACAPPLGLDEIGSEIYLRGRVILGVLRYCLLHLNFAKYCSKDYSRQTRTVLWKGLDEIYPKPPLSLGFGRYRL